MCVVCFVCCYSCMTSLLVMELLSPRVWVFVSLSERNSVMCISWIEYRTQIICSPFSLGRNVSHFFVIWYGVDVWHGFPNSSILPIHGMSGNHGTNEWYTHRGDTVLWCRLDKLSSVINMFVVSVVCHHSLLWPIGRGGGGVLVSVFVVYTRGVVSERIH